MAQIILFRPKETYSSVLDATMPPLGLLYLATPLLRQGYTVKIIDCGTIADWRSELRKSVDTSTICAGVTAMTGYQIKGALDFSREIKRMKALPVVWGGLHPSLLPDQTISNEFVDVVVKGEGERKFSELVRRLRDKESLDGIKGIIFKRENEIKNISIDGELMDLNDLGIPAYELIDMRYYMSRTRAYFPQRMRILDLNTDRGCPYRCAFCYNIKFNKRRWRAMSAARILDIIEELKRKFDIDAINIVSDNFFVDKKRVLEFCEGLLKRKLGIAWHADIRIDTFLHYERDLVGLFRKSGCFNLTFGIESGSDKVLRLIQKDITVDSILKAHRKAKDTGFMTTYHFMVGFPGETRRDILDTVKLINILKKDRDVFILGPAVYVPYPGTPLFDRCIEMGFRLPERLESWIDYDWDENSKLPWFSRSFKNYLLEVKHVVERFANPVDRRDIKKVLFKRYCGLRFAGLISNIRIFDLDFKLLKLYKIFSGSFIEYKKAINIPNSVT